LYEIVFEPFSLDLAGSAIEALALRAGETVLDVGAGTGGVALALARRGCHVSAVDASPRMVERLEARAADSGFTIDARVVDGQALTYPDATFDAAVSVFGVVLFPDAVRGLAEMRRVVRPGGGIAVVTWTEPQHYELASELRAAVVAVRPEQPPAPLPAQLRFRERADLLALFHAAGLEDVQIDVRRAELTAPSARWLAARLPFAPGMAAQLQTLGSDAPAVVERFVANLEARHGMGEIRLGGVAFVAVATVAGG
jgi:SAM-dependent methyltransferase